MLFRSIGGLSTAPLYERLETNPGNALHPMKKRSFRPLLIVFLWSWLTICSQGRDTIAFVDVTILPMDRDVALPHHTVVVAGDRITAMGPTQEVSVPDGSQIIDGAGKYLIPGLAEMHGHNPPAGSSQSYIENTYFLFLANGVTTVRGMLGWPGQLELRDRIRTGQLLGPTLYLAGPSFSGATVRSPSQAEQRVRQQKSEGWDLLKVHPGLKRSDYDAMARTADSVGIRFAGHVPADVGLLHAIEKGQETIDHLDGYIEYLQADRSPIDPARLREIVKITRDTGTWVVPTMVLWETIIGAASLEKMSAYPELRYMPAAEVQRWISGYQRRLAGPSFDRESALQIAANRRILLLALHDGGARILFGTDSPQQFSVPGFSIHREMKAMVDCGMTPFEVLQTATKNVGDYFKGRDTFGLVAIGQRADLLLLKANPVSNLANLTRRAGVMVRGRWIPESEIAAGLARIAAESRQ